MLVCCNGIGLTPFYDGGTRGILPQAHGHPLTLEPSLSFSPESVEDSGGGKNSVGLSRANALRSSFLTFLTAHIKNGDGDR